MSYIRSSSKRKYTDGSSMYVFLHTDGHLEWMLGDASKPEDFIEMMFRILDHAGVDFSEEDVIKVKEELEV